LKGERRLGRKEEKKDEVGMMGERSCLYAATKTFDEELDPFGGLLLTLRRPKGDNTLLVLSFVFSAWSGPLPHSLLAASISFHIR
jgi:hypothetical protein